MNNQQEFSIEENQVKQEDHSNAPWITKQGEKVLNEHDSRIGLSGLIIIDEVNTLDEECFGEEDVEDNSDD